ncbi:MAG: hypothetical protein JKY37_26660, partial [Nannocystaceae bacterium]|nr:hypothetical protein [Nannocystaceae bacterium]
TPSADDGTTTGDSGTPSAPDEPVDPPIKLDLGAIPDAPDFDTACRKVDFLFVIDNSGSMFTVQQALVNNFPVFIDGIQSTLDSVMSYQVGIVTTDQYSANIPGCTGLPSLVVQTGGGGSSNETCGPYADGFNYMTEADDLSATFACAAQVGTSGNAIELPMAAVEQVVTRTEGGPGQCNDGFIRDDALLVIVIITDEADGAGDPKGAQGVGSSLGTPQSWFDTVVETKMGVPENVVVLSLINYAGGPCPPASPFSDGQNIADFTALFGENGFVGGICEPDFTPIFEAAIGVIDEARENFVAPN